MASRSCSLYEAAALSPATPRNGEIALAVQLGIGDDGQIIFKANAVREPPHRTARADKVPEFPGAVQRGRVIINVVVDVCLVCVGGNEKGVLAFVQRIAVS